MGEREERRQAKPASSLLPEFTITVIASLNPKIWAQCGDDKLISYFIIPCTSTLCPLSIVERG
jgi:hypothetical protein